MPSGRRPALRAAARTRSTMSRRAATSSDALARALGRVDDVERLEVEDRAVERHRDLVLRLEAHGRLELLAVRDRRQLEDADDDLLVGDADADALVEALVVATERRAAPSARRSTSTTSPSRTTPGSSGATAARSTDDAAVDGDLRGGDAAGLDVEADEGAVRLCHGEVGAGLGRGWTGSARSSAPRRADLSPRGRTVRRPLDMRPAGPAARSGRGRRRRAPSPTKNASTPPSARNGPNGTAVLRRPSAAPLRAMITAPTTTPAISAMKIAGATARPEVEAQDAGELDVAHAHARAGRRARRAKKKPPPPAPAISCSTHEVRVAARGRATSGSDGQRRRERVGDASGVEVDERDRDEERHEQRGRATISARRPSRRATTARRAAAVTASTSG